MANTRERWTDTDNPYDELLYLHQEKYAEQWLALTANEKMKLIKNNYTLLNYLRKCNLDEDIILTKYFPYINNALPFYLIREEVTEHFTTSADC